MNKFSITTIITLITLWPSDLLSQSIEDITWVTDGYPPYNYIEDGEHKGPTVQILKYITNEHVKDLNSRIEYKPWTEAYNKALNKENVGIFSLIRTKERNNLFQWVGPVGVSQVHIITHKSKNIDSTKLKNLKYGAIKNDVGYQLIKKEFTRPNIKFAKDLTDLINKLSNNEVDAIAYELNVFKYKLDTLNIANTYKSIKKLSSTPIYIGISKKTNPDIAKKLQINLQKLKGIRPQ